MSLTIAAMTEAELEVAIDWAAAEGWNPGLEDAGPFLAADSNGFLMARLGEIPVACISVVRHTDAFGFLGFYICHPEHRGRGYGWAVWQAGLAHLGERTVGLDGVVDQQGNYRRSGFALAYRNLRYAGRLATTAPSAARPATPADMPAMLRLGETASGTPRTSYLSTWFTNSATRRTFVLPAADGLDAVGTIRQCRKGAKIGPIYARSEAAADALLATLGAEAGGATVFIDVPETQTAFRARLEREDFAAMFETARMYKGRPPPERPDLVFGQATLELG